MDPQPETVHPQADGAPSMTQEQVVPVTAADSVDLVWVGAGFFALLLLVTFVVRRLATVPEPTQLPHSTLPQDAIDTVEAIPFEPVGPSAEVDLPAREIGIVARMRAALDRTRSGLGDRLDRMLGRETLDESVIEELEEALLLADVGIETATRLLEPLRPLVRAGASGDTLRDALRGQIQSLLAPMGKGFTRPAKAPWVILVVGVNGSGKTTTIGKLAARLVKQGDKVMLAAGDTYRAAAAEQLQVWAQRAGADIVMHQEGADPGAVAYDALESAMARGYDVVIIDTAGRLQTARPLMEQLSKVRRVIQKQVPEGPHETLLVLDGTMGQNGLSQARLFNDATPLTAVAVTKLDGTAKGGMILTIAAEMDLPVKLVGLGEKVDDLQDFDGPAFAQALL